MPMRKAAESVLKLKRSLREARQISFEEIQNIVMVRQWGILKDFFRKAGKLGNVLPQEIVAYAGRPEEYRVATLAGELGGRTLYFLDDSFWFADELSVSEPAVLRGTVPLADEILQAVVCFCEQEFSEEKATPSLKTYPGLFPVRVCARWAAGGHQDNETTEWIIVVKADEPEQAAKKAATRLHHGRLNVLESLHVFVGGEWRLARPRVDGQSVPYPLFDREIYKTSFAIT